MKLTEKEVFLACLAGVIAGEHNPFVHVNWIINRAEKLTDEIIEKLNGEKE